MFSTIIFLKKSFEVLSYFQCKSNFSDATYAALFSNSDYYYAIVLTTSSETIPLLKSKLLPYALTDKSFLARGDSQGLYIGDNIEYKLRVFPILNMLSVKEFYQSITSDIAQLFLQQHHCYLDYDFISEESNQLFVFTVSEKNNNQADNSDRLRLHFPEFYARLDKLILEDIGKSITLKLECLHDPQSTPKYTNLDVVLFSSPLKSKESKQTETSLQNTCGKK